MTNFLAHFLVILFVLLVVLNPLRAFLKKSKRKALRSIGNYCFYAHPKKKEFESNKWGLRSKRFYVKKYYLEKIFR